MSEEKVVLDEVVETAMADVLPDEKPSSHYHEEIIRSRRPFWSSNQIMEPKK